MKSAKIIVTIFLSILTSIHFLNAQNGPNAEEYFRMADDLKKNMKPDSAIMYYEMAAVEFQAMGNTENWIEAPIIK